MKESVHAEQFLYMKQVLQYVNGHADDMQNTIMKDFLSTGGWYQELIRELLRNRNLVGSIDGDGRWGC